MLRLIQLATAFVCLLAVARAEDECVGGLRLCDWEPWSGWSLCNKNCGAGLRTRSRGICCALGESMDKCLEKCSLPDNSFESEDCENVCPAGNCTSEEIKDTGVAATDFTTLTDEKSAILNAPMMLSVDFDDCKKACFNMDLGGGLHCWTFTFQDPNQCQLYFFSRPLILTHPERKGQAPGQSMHIRHCSDTVECKATAADIVFVVDSSGSIGGYNFDKVKKFLQDLVSRFDVEPVLTRIGMLVYNDNMKWEFKLGELNTLLDVLKAIKNIQYVVGGTLTATALETVMNEGFVSNRTGVPKIVVVVTDGLSRYPSLTRVRASMLRHMGVQMYAIGVGDKTNQEELYNMVTSPEETHMFEFSSFDDLDASNVTIETAYRPCIAKHVSNMTTPTTTIFIDNCTDTIDNCASYGQDVCTDFGPWAHSHCSLFCGFCKSRVTTDGACYDKLPNCASYGNYVCEDRAYVDWANTNCQKYCGICGSPVKTTPTTTPIPTTTVKICEDTIDNCDGYLSSCKDPQFHGFLNARCPASCGYCTSHKDIHASVINGIPCPGWSIPAECDMVKVSPDCCPLPRCPNTYFYTAEKPSS